MASHFLLLLLSLNWLHANTIGNENCARTAGQLAHESLFRLFLLLVPLLAELYLLGIPN